MATPASGGTRCAKNKTYDGLVRQYVAAVDLQTQLYAWHSRHHVAHITRLREQKGW